MDPPSVRIRPSPHPATRAFGIFGRSVARPVVALFVLLILALASDFRSAPSEPSLIHQRLVPLPSGAPRAAVTRHRRVKGEVLIRGGSFAMGSSAGEAGRQPWEGPVRRVTVSRSFYLGRYEVTIGRFMSEMGYNPQDGDGSSALPVADINWHEAVAFCNALSVKRRLPRCFDCKGRAPKVVCRLKSRYRGRSGRDYLLCRGYRLPTEAEWEYAARAGSSGPTHDALQRFSWYQNNAKKTTHPVGTRKPNAWGLHDMIGNVWEWVWDVGDRSEDDGYPSPTSVTDPIGERAGRYRIVRGCGFSSGPEDCRFARRSKDLAGPDPKGGDRGSHIGFRVARSAI